MIYFRLLVVPAIFLSACIHLRNSTIHGNGQFASEQRSLTNFTKVDVSGSFDVFVTQGATALVRVDADQNLQPYIQTKVAGDRLFIEEKENYNLRSNNSIKIYVTAPVFRSLSISGSGGLKSTAPIIGDHLNFSIAGSGDMDVKVDAPAIETDIAGSGSISVAGNTKNLHSTIRGSGDLYAYNLLSENTDVHILGSGNARVFASKQLKAGITGSGDVEYKGTASVNQSIAGSGHIRKAE